MSDDFYPHTKIIKWGDGFAPAVMGRTAFGPAHPREHWLKTLDRVTQPPVLLDERPRKRTWLERLFSR